MQTCRLTAAVIGAVFMFGAGTATALGGSGSRRAAVGPGLGGVFSTTPRPPARPVRPDTADWQRIRAAAHLRHLALEPHRSARFRSFSAFLGLSELVTIHPLGPGPCATAVTFLYDNLLDLQDAFQGENWNPLRRLVAKGPSIRACAPPHVRRPPP